MTHKEIASLLYTVGFTSALLVFTCVLIPSPAMAVVKRHVVIVGNNNSVEKDINSLHYADDDAVHYYQLFQPFAQNIELLTKLDDNSQRRYSGLAHIARLPTRQELRAALQRSFEKIRRAKQLQHATELFFVFVGHGGVDGEGKGYVHLADTRFTRSDLFHHVIAESPADSTHLIIDACNSLALVAGRGQTDAPADSIENQFKNFLSGHDLEDYPNVGVLAATSEDQETHEWSRIKSGVFSHHVRSAISGAADINLDGVLEYSEIAAFIDAGTADLARLGKHLHIFAWPPTRDRRYPLIDVKTGVGLRRIVVDDSVSGRLFLERESGERWIEFHAPLAQKTILYVPATLLFFLRDGEHEMEITAADKDVWVREPPDTPYRVARRGAVDRAFESGLFALPYNTAYYRGYISGRSQFVPVDLVTKKWEPKPPGTGFRLAAGYHIGASPVVQQHLEHGGYGRFQLPLLSGFAFSAELNGSHTWLTNGNGLSRAAVIPGLEYRYQWRDLFAIQSALELGYGMIVVSGRNPSADYTVAIARGRLGIDMHLWGPVWMQIGGTYTAYLQTLDGAEVVRTAPRGSLGLLFSDLEL